MLEHFEPPSEPSVTSALQSSDTCSLAPRLERFSFFSPESLTVLLSPSKHYSNLLMTWQHPFSRLDTGLVQSVGTQGVSGGAAGGSAFLAGWGGVSGDR